MSAKTKGRLSGRLIYVATIVAILGVTGGVAMGSFLSATPVNQQVNYYQGTSSNVNGYGGSPTLAVAYVPAAVSVCSSSTVTASTSGGTTNLYLSSTTGGTVCTTGDFAEMFTVAFSATLASAQSNPYTISTQVGSNPVQTNTLSLTMSTGSPFTQTVNVYIDYGSNQIPAAGISMVNLLIQ